MNLRVKVLRCLFPSYYPFGVKHGKATKTFLKSELETQTQRLQIVPFPQHFHYHNLDLSVSRLACHSQLVMEKNLHFCRALLYR